MKTKTFVAVARKRHQDAQQSIMESLKMTELEHNTLLFEYGIEFLHSLYPEESAGFMILSRLPSFWKWYRTEWYFAQKKWFEISDTFISSPDFILKVLYLEHMKMKCIESRNIIQAFDMWRKAQ